MSIAIRDVSAQDLEALIELNECEVPHVNSVPLSLFEWFAQEAAYFRVARAEGRVVGFLAGLAPAMPHTSQYFRWFRERYSDFIYIDRVVVSPESRRLGVAARLYGDMETTFGERVSMLACEVNLVPRNEPSLRFHARMGFRSIGTLETENGTKQVSLLVKRLAGPARS
ncbi:MAG: GNAT family N-acetyltransferase [Gammaproteobacteria bacterium]|nr:GNAT family N-acetyltransferase [Gammaproteobacteria bacterium]NIR85794.1 GNAT family N-acetyltransferase [Gammaproteobacteria bacterium]NIR90548.1 GNAT family N-acetyltransferase [Gammaproteobacteria bacterium]NIU06929.1 GNAT family N-acetyltransferase [Gammaproteobacteria bacterium]NIV53859.1 GNAT family N-acetyltransferase [Gammaproteobacteria bacterium]